ncbi:MAG TPA: SCO family protein [Gemmatimonas sp.]|nr:SCO family protein [Gemmatimonas sp.]
MMADPRSLFTRRARLLALRAMASCGLLLSGCDSGPLRGVALDPPKAIPMFAFTRANGAMFETKPAGDGLMVFFFGYTNCPDVCPTTLADWKRVKARLGGDTSRVQFVFVTVDPERDTPDVAQKYAEGFDRSFIGVSGDSATTARIQQAFGVASIRDATTADAEYLVSHSSQSFLVNGEGRLVSMYSFGSGWDALLDDIKRLL